MLGFTVAMCLGMGSGCGQDRTLQAADPRLLDSIAQTGMGSPMSLSRAQMPDVQQTSTWNRKPLDLAPERSSEAANVPAAARIRVVVNGEPILDEEIRATCYQELKNAEQLPNGERQKRQGEILLAALNSLIEREIVLQDAQNRLGGNKNGQKFLEKLKEAAKKDWEKTRLRPIREQTKLQNDEDIRALFKAQGMSMDLMYRQFERNFMMMEYLRNRVWTSIDKIGFVEIKDYYDTHPEEFEVDDAVEWQDIFVAASKHPSREAARRFAEVLIAKTRLGEDFLKLAAEWDNGDSFKYRNGAGEGMHREDIQPREAVNVLFRLHEGEVGPIIEIAGGFHIVRVAKRINKGRRPLDEEMQKQIKNRLRNETAQREMKKIIQDLKKEAIIEHSLVTN
jgi:peptidyl-prolyl cis-trans isomerase SurA